MKKKGFTLVEVLTVIMIVAVLAAVAAPMYDKAIERSHMAEARTVLNQMFESKQRTLDSMGKKFYTEGENQTPVFGVRQLDMNLACPKGGNAASGAESYYCQTKDFRYTLLPNSSVNLPEKMRTLVDDEGFELRAGDDLYPSYFNMAVCAARCGGDYHNTSFLYLGNFTSDPEKMICGGSKAACNLYGMVQSSSTPWCTCD